MGTAWVGFGAEPGVGGPGILTKSELPLASGGLDAIYCAGIRNERYIAADSVLSYRMKNLQLLGAI